MTPTAIIIYVLALVFSGSAFLLLSGMLYYLAHSLRELNATLSDLVIRIEGLPQNLSGISPAIKTLAQAVPAHTAQVEALVGVIQAANTNTPPDKPEPFRADGPDTNWTAQVPPSPFDEPDESR